MLLIMQSSLRIIERTKDATFEKGYSRFQEPRGKEYEADVTVDGIKQLTIDNCR